MSSLTRYGIPALLLLGLGFVVYVWVSASSTPDSASGLKSFAKGDLQGMIFDANAPERPDALIEGPDGPVTLGELDSDYLVVNFWATNCPPCILEMPTLADLQDKHDVSQIRVVPVSLDRQGDHPQAKALLDELSKDRLPFYSDYKMKTLFDTKSRGFPTTIIYNRQGKELGRYEGEANWSGEDADIFFEALIAQAPQTTKKPDA